MSTRGGKGGKPAGASFCDNALLRACGLSLVLKPIHSQHMSTIPAGKPPAPISCRRPNAKKTGGTVGAADLNNHALIIISDSPTVDASIDLTKGSPPSLESLPSAAKKPCVTSAVDLTDSLSVETRPPVPGAKKPRKRPEVLIITSSVKGSQGPTEGGTFRPPVARKKKTHKPKEVRGSGFLWWLANDTSSSSCESSDSDSCLPPLSQVFPSPQTTPPVPCTPIKHLQLCSPQTSASGDSGNAEPSSLTSRISTPVAFLPTDPSDLPDPSPPTPPLHPPHPHPPPPHRQLDVAPREARDHGSESDESITPPLYSPLSQCSYESDMECNAESISAPKPGSSPLPPPPPPTPPPPRTVDEELELLMKQRGMSMNFDKVPTIHLFSGIQAMIAEQDLSVGGSTVCFSTTVASAVSYILTTTSARVMPWASTLAQLWAIVADETCVCDRMTEDCLNTAVSFYPFLLALHPPGKHSVVDRVYAEFLNSFSKDGSPFALWEEIQRLISGPTYFFPLLSFLVDLLLADFRSARANGIGDQALFVRVFWQSSQMKHVTLPVRRLLDSCRNLLTVATNEHPYEVYKLNACFALVFLVGTRCCEDLATELSILTSDLPPSLHTSFLSLLCPRALKEAVLSLSLPPQPTPAAKTFLNSLSRKALDNRSLPSSTSLPPPPPPSSTSASMPVCSLSSSSSSPPSSSSAASMLVSKRGIPTARQTPRGNPSGVMESRGDVASPVVNPPPVLHSRSSEKPLLGDRTLVQAVQRWGPGKNAKTSRTLTESTFKENVGKRRTARVSGSVKPRVEAFGRASAKRPSVRTGCENCRNGTCLRCRRSNVKQRTLPWH